MSGRWLRRKLCRFREGSPNRDWVGRVLSIFFLSALVFSRLLPLLSVPASASRRTGKHVWRLIHFYVTGFVRLFHHQQQPARRRWILFLFLPFLVSVLGSGRENITYIFSHTRLSRLKTTIPTCTYCTTYIPPPLSKNAGAAFRRMDGQAGGMGRTWVLDASEPSRARMGWMDGGGGLYTTSNFHGCMAWHVPHREV